MSKLKTIVLALGAVTAYGLRKRAAAAEEDKPEAKKRSAPARKKKAPARRRPAKRARSSSVAKRGAKR
jgi:hypothetical protein